MISANLPHFTQIQPILLRISYSEFRELFPYLIVVQHDELGAVELLLLGLHGLLHDLLLEGGGLGVGARHLTGLGNCLGLGPSLRLGLSLQHYTN